MLVRCVNNSGVEKYLTIGKLYDVSRMKRILYGVKDDTGIIWHFAKTRFVLADAGDQGSDDQTKQDAR